MKEEYISFGDTLINNKALTAKIPYTDKDKQLKNYTNCVALNSYSAIFCILNASLTAARFDPPR